MIAPGGGESGDGICRLTRGFFEGGGLEQAFLSEGGGYEIRPEQREMAAAVASALDAKEHLAVEAGTGVGKSFAYLVPMIFAAREGGLPAVVSTYTISLQEQLIRKDIPFLKRALGIDFRAVLAKGRGNYLCRRRLARALRASRDMFNADEERDLAGIARWASEAQEGSMQEMGKVLSPSVWSTVCAEEGNCLGQKCPEFRDCFFMRARRRIFEADLVVVNHHLFFAELALRAQGVSFLPRYEAVVLDEAHQIENVASEHFGIRLSRFAFEHWLRRLYVPESRKGILALLRAGELAKEVTDLWDEVAAMFQWIDTWAGFEQGGTQRVVGERLATGEGVLGGMARICNGLKLLGEGRVDEDIAVEIEAVRRRGLEMSTALGAFLGQTLGDHVYWVEREGATWKRLVLYAAPVEVAPLLRETLFAQVPTVVMTSATLAVSGSMEYFLQRTGAEGSRTLMVGSPFDYARQMRILIPKGMPDPNDDERFEPAVAEAVLHFVRRSRGRAFVLFTSARLMRRIAERVRGEVEAAGFPLYVQGEGLSRGAMVERFREDGNAVLFGLDSFWMGVDVRGEALANVIITRLPFAVPDQPLAKARMERIRERGGDPFREYSLPEAVLKFRQGVGRLIRTGADEGIVVVLDGRILRKWYGRIFLASLPECPVETLEGEWRR